VKVVISMLFDGDTTGAPVDAEAILDTIPHQVHQPIPHEAGAADVREAFRTAPPMEGDRVSAGLAVNTPAPDFVLPDADNTPVRLSDFRGRPVALVFYPLDWSPGCSVQLDLYEQELDEFTSRGVQLLGISVDSIYSHGAWAVARGITFPLLADFNPKGEVARRYGIWREPDGFSERAVYLVDGDGMIAWAHVSPKLHHLPDFDELVTALDAVGLDNSTSKEGS
jgi:peroxiredoxin